MENATPIVLEGTAVQYFSSVNPANVTLHVPAGSETAYSNAAIWKEFDNIISIGSEGPEVPEFPGWKHPPSSYIATRSYTLRFTEPGSMFDKGHAHRSIPYGAAGPVVCPPWLQVSYALLYVNRYGANN